jgi:hypothetical protein
MKVKLMLKDKIYRTNPGTEVKDLKGSIRREMMKLLRENFFE